MMSFDEFAEWNEPRNVIRRFNDLNERQRRRWHWWQRLLIPRWLQREVNWSTKIET